MTRSPLIACLLLAALATTARAGEYREFHKVLEPFTKLKDLKYLVPTVKVAPKDAALKPESVVLVIHSRAGAIRVPAMADGSIDFPVTQALYDENPNVDSNAPPGTLGLSVGIDVGAPPAQRFDYRMVMDMKADWDEAVRRQNFMWRMLAPSPRGALVVFTPGTAATAEVKLPGGVRTYRADAAGELRLPFDEAWHKANPPVLLSAMPKRIALDFRK